ncbi:MAG: Stk1 family PASTA domain-containing Ser/Thr kinase [Clostridia bacterium]|nr:Stk1 family PASTA domain-containing Ser/Thr kinase [Clostridia bacterium]
MNLVGKTLCKRYEVLEEVGIGGMATVYKAKCNLLNRFVAIKVLKDEFAKDAEFVKKFRAEAQSAAALTHPNIVSVYDVGEEDGINYIVMELLVGETLKDYIDHHGKLSNERTLKYASQIASALEAAHSSKIVHRDIKPHNIVLANNNTVAKVTDFGIAKMSSNETIANGSQTMGSVHYFSPEQAKGGYTDEKTDIYSLGVVMYEMVTGEVPFEADTPVSVALKQIQEEPIEPKEKVPTVTNALNKIILKAMAKNTSERYQTASELLDDIFAAMNNVDIEEKTEDVVVGFKKGSTQVVPVITKKDLQDNLNDVNVTSRKSERVGKKIEELENDKSEKRRIDSLNESPKQRKAKIIKRIIITLIIILVLAGIGVLTYKLVETIKENNKPIVVEKVDVAPDLVGSDYEEARVKYEKLGLIIKISKYEETDEFPAGQILDQNIKKGEKITDGKMTVVVAKGVKKIAMPDVVGKDYKVAKYELEALGFKVDIKNVVSDKVEKDLVVKQSLKHKEQFVTGTKVLLEVSEGDGKDRIIVPSVIGNTEASAKSKLQKLKLVVNVSYVNDPSKSDGIVVSQSLKENKEVVEGTVIEITVNRLEKTKNVTIKLKDYTANMEDESINVKVKAQVEGVTNTIHSRTHTKGENGYENFTVEVNGFSTAKLTIYINDKVVETVTISF